MLFFETGLERNLRRAWLEALEARREATSTSTATATSMAASTSMAAPEPSRGRARHRHRRGGGERGGGCPAGP